MLISIYPNLKNKIYTMKEYAEIDNNGEDLNISDPWGYNQEVYMNCIKEIKKCLDIIIHKIRN